MPNEQPSPTRAVVTAGWRVLLVEDSPTDAALIVRELEKSGRLSGFSRVETADEMRSALDSAGWDVVTSDWSMPRFTAPAALAMVKERGLEVPFIIVSGTLDEEVAVDAMRLGAHDFVLKDRLSRLVPAIERELRECAQRVALRRADHALYESEHRFQTLFRSGIIGIVVADTFGTLHEGNDAYLKMVGYTREELLNGGIRWTDLTPPSGVAAARAAEAQLQRFGVAPVFETESYRKDGSIISIALGIAMLEHPKCLVIVADLTPRKLAEAARVRAEEALRQSEGQLRHSQKMEAVGRLAGGVAHDFNNILSVILSYSDFILKDLHAGDPMHADMEEIRDAAQRAAALTRQLLLFSRQQVVEPRVLDLAELVGGMAPMLRRLLGEDVELTVLHQGDGRVKLDPGQMEQVVLNLAVNARDAMPAGGHLTIETNDVDLDDAYALGHLPAKAGPYVMMAVSDDGCGMDRATQARIFEPFFTTKPTGKGTGLGLSTVFGSVQVSGGHIWVYSEPGVGSSFKVYLPRVDAETARAVSAPSPTPLRGTETVLVVEDEDQVRTIVAYILRRSGYRVLVAENAGEALLACEQHPEPIALLLTDVVMPHLSGPELAKRLLALRPAMKVLYMSGYTDDAVVRHGVLAGGGAFVQKPITPVSLTSKVRAVLDASLARP